MLELEDEIQMKIVTELNTVVVFETLACDNACTSRRGNDGT